MTHTTISIPVQVYQDSKRHYESIKETLYRKGIRSYSAYVVLLLYQDMEQQEEGTK